MIGLVLSTFIIGSTQINMVWVSPNIAPVALSIMPFYFRAGDHRVFLINFTLELLEEDEFILIVKPAMRQLILSQVRSVENYISKVE